MASQHSDSDESSVASLDTRDPTLEDLVEMLLASKRSLASINQIWRAREIVDASREAVEENAVLTARNTFIQHAVSDQLGALEAIRHGVRVVELEGHQELKDITKALDHASSNLNSILDSLREISVESAFRPADEKSRFLFDFVDEAGVNDLYDSIRQGIDRCDVARRTLIETYTSFDNDLKAIGKALQEDQENTQVIYTDGENVSPIPSLYYFLENNATACAEHLQGLIKHYDLCVVALKHTEGGGEIVTKFSQDNQEESKLAGFGLGITDAEEEARKAINPEEQANMLKILVKDSAEVEDVVIEISDRIGDMEEHFTQIQSYILMLRSTSRRQAKAVVLVKKVAANVPGYINACAEFQSHWEEEQEGLIEKVEEIESLQEFYTGFASGYDNLILEVQRRRQALRDMEKVARHAMSQIDKLHRAELAAREHFKTELGEYLPSDIWPGLHDPPTRFQINTDDEEVGPLPELKKDVVQKALQRLKLRPSD